MEIKITENNINKYRDNRFDNINIIKWEAGELDKKIIDNFPNLQELYCGYNLIKSLEALCDCVSIQVLDCRENQIVTLEPLSGCINLQKIYCCYNKIKILQPLYNCVNLQEFDCSYNQIITLEPLHNCVNLQILNCCGNKVTSLKQLHTCVNLQILNCDTNKIVSLEPLYSCINLQKLSCDCNQIISLKPLSNCLDLQVLYCSYNRLKSLEPLSNCINLHTLQCNNNLITLLEPLSNCVNLHTLQCFQNQIRSLGPLVHLRRLRYIDYSGNPIEIPTMQIQRMLNRIDSNRKSSIYYDNQNVHDTEIQRTVCDSVQNLLKDPKNDFIVDDIINSSLNESTIESLIEYCHDQTIHSIHLITYQELFSLVWNRIQNSIHQSELMKILEEQIADSQCKCFTGRFNRTLSVLVGFFDDIKINISDKSRISAIILNSKDKIIPYDAVKHKEAATKELIEAGYLEVDFKDWIDAIED